MTSRHVLVWRQLHWQRPLDLVRSAAVLRQWATDARSPVAVLEARATAAGVAYCIGAAPEAITGLTTALGDLAGAKATTLGPEAARLPVDVVGSLRLNTRHRPLKTAEPETTVYAVLAALTRVRADEELVLQLVLGPRRIPLAVPTNSPSALTAPWYVTAWHGTGNTLDGEKRTALRTKVADHGFACTLRLGARAATAEVRRARLLGLLAALRTVEAPGVQLRLAPERPDRLNAARTPWRWPLRLSVPELVPLTAWPLGADYLPGQPAAHPRLLPPTPGTVGRKRVLATVTASGHRGTLALGIPAALQHLHVVGPTGTGKSTLLANFIRQDIADGRAVVVVEPKGDLVADVLARVPSARWDDVVVLDAQDPVPVGLNPLARHGRRPELVADTVLSIFKQLYGKNVGPRSQDILYASLLTLVRRDDASLAMLPLLLTNPGVRRRLTAGIRDPLLLEPFWATYEAWSEAERLNAVAPVMNKLRPLLRPGLRGVLAQRQPRFSLKQVLTERRILLVPLQRGVIGDDAARLLGSLVVAELWQTLQSRAAIPAERRHPVMVYIDEVQDYLHTGTPLDEVLAQTRGYGAGFTLAHQFLKQLPDTMQSAVLANARSRVAFTLSEADARVIARGHPELSADDLTALSAYAIYASLHTGHGVSPFVSGRTLPLPPPTADPAELRRRSRERWGRPLDEVDAGLADLLLPASTAPAAPTGRRRRQP
ncbi:type IV secretory system conjugative DNA transfer family protein [Geodermatophilus sp. DSM 45219]|uniref:type IV secretory system conjugative DNA transfer family protein n=1 Tax=Geodermatophilus sp. DSM 45219 TaxID=1881103 RepID=UPI00088BA489|nr:type IV secretion system DNA-binding domain-containing protein [Geodermatophilus sp. DSM 45219]SDN38708.1 Type IV secretion-system coupling protein DNA-binding domain-containing protein [Geodermatophilus sp. DSM 45219]